MPRPRIERYTASSPSATAAATTSRVRTAAGHPVVSGGYARGSARRTCLLRLSTYSRGALATGDSSSARPRAATVDAAGSRATASVAFWPAPGDRLREDGCWCLCSASAARATGSGWAPPGSGHADTSSRSRSPRRPPPRAALSWRPTARLNPNAKNETDESEQRGLLHAERLAHALLVLPQVSARDGKPAKAVEPTITATRMSARAQPGRRKKYTGRPSLLRRGVPADAASSGARD